MSEEGKRDALPLSAVIESHRTFSGHILILDDDTVRDRGLPIRLLAEAKLVILVQDGSEYGMVVKARNYTGDWVRMA